MSICAVDETCIHQNTLETKQQPKRWVYRGESMTKMFKVDSSRKKEMAYIVNLLTIILHKYNVKVHSMKNIHEEGYELLPDLFAVTIF